MRLRLAAAIPILCAAGCAAILGIEDRPLADAVTAVEAGADLCSHVQPPPRTHADDDPATANQYIVAAHGIDLAPPAGSSIGFDLDDTCTCDPTSTLHDAGPSCTSTKSRNCDDDGGTGIDDAFGRLGFIGLLSGTSFGGDAGQNNEGIVCGRSTLLVVLGKYNGRANDDDVRLSLVLSPGVQTPHEAGETPSVCNDDPGKPIVYTPRWDGTDQWSSDTRFVITKTLTPTQALSGYVRDYTLVATASEGGGIKIPFGPIIADAHGAIVVAHLVPKDGGFAIDEGQLAGRLTIASLIPALSSTPLGGKAGYVCPNNKNAALYASIVDSLCTARDIVADPVQDFTGVACDSISSAVRFFGDPAQMTLPIDPADAGTSDCPGVTTTCD